MRTILLDGLWGSPWRLRGMQRNLQSRNLGPVDIFSYNSSGTIPLETLADELAGFLGGAPARIVAHSMGGIITRLACQRHNTIQIVQAALLCVPHHGSALAGIIPFAGVRQLAPGSGVLKSLAAQEWRIPTMTIWCPGDLLVVPGSSARWKKAIQEICCPIPLHNWPVISRHYHHRIADFFLSQGTA
jgi:pimeloyl-ACP methyl ester carboxylesterase